MDIRTETLMIDGMTCGHCVAAVRRSLDGIDGVEVKDVSLGRAVVALDPGRTNREALVAAVEEEGYAVQPA